MTAFTLGSRIDRRSVLSAVPSQLQQTTGQTDLQRSALSATRRPARSTSGTRPVTTARVVGKSEYNPKNATVRHGTGVKPAAFEGLRYLVMTHSDITGHITVEVAIGQSDPGTLAHGRPTAPAHGSDAVFRQHSDAVFAKWLSDPSQPTAGGLLVRCHVTGQNWLQRMIEPFRRRIFLKEMSCVVTSLMHAEQALLEAMPELRKVPVWVHFQSTSKRAGDYDQLVCLGPLEYAPKMAQVYLEYTKANAQAPSLDTLLAGIDVGDTPLACPVGWRHSGLREFGRSAFQEATAIFPPVVLPKDPKISMSRGERDLLANNIVRAPSRGRFRLQRQ